MLWCDDNKGYLEEMMGYAQCRPKLKEMFLTDFKMVVEYIIVLFVIKVAKGMLWATFMKVAITFLGKIVLWVFMKIVMDNFLI